MPRGDGKKYGERRNAEFPKNNPYVPKKLRRRLYDFAEDKLSPSVAGMAKKPGSQNPRKRGPRRKGGV